jgi:hypothetical protein
MKGPGRDETGQMKGPGRYETGQMKGPGWDETGQMKGPGRYETGRKKGTFTRGGIERGLRQIETARNRQRGVLGMGKRWGNQHG